MAVTLTVRVKGWFYYSKSRQLIEMNSPRLEKGGNPISTWLGAVVRNKTTKPLTVNERTANICVLKDKALINTWNGKNRRRGFFYKSKLSDLPLPFAPVYSTCIIWWVDADIYNVESQGHILMHAAPALEQVVLAVKSRVGWVQTCTVSWCRIFLRLSPGF